MKKGLRLGAGIAAIAAMLVVVAVANAAYTSPKLQVTQAGATTVITASAAQTDDSTARVAIYLPTGATVTTGQAPGSKIGTVAAQVSALALGGALLPLAGDILIAPAGAVPPATQAACTQGQAPTTTWLLVLQAAGQTINLPAFILPTVGAETALGQGKIVFCLAPPDIPVASGGATFGAKFLSAKLTLTGGVVSAVPAGVFLTFWTPWQAGNGQINAAGTVASPAAVAPGAVSVTAKRAGLGAVVAGRVTQGGAARPGVKVAIWGGARKTGLRKLGTATTKANGTYSLRTRTGTFFQARAAAASAAAASVCAAVTPGLGGVPCVNPTINAFARSTSTIRKK